MSSVWPSEIWIFMVHNATKLHIMTLNYHIRVFGMESGPNLFFLRIVYFWICQCVFEKNIARRRARLRTGPSLACMEATATKRPSAAHYYNPRQSSSLRLSLQKDNPTLALCTLTYVWVLNCACTVSIMGVLWLARNSTLCIIWGSRLWLIVQVSSHTWPGLPARRPKLNLTGPACRVKGSAALCAGAIQPLAPELCLQ